MIQDKHSTGVVCMNNLYKYCTDPGNLNI